MTRIIERLDEIAPDYDALFCDVWGCLHDGLDPLPEAVAALRGFRRDGGVVILITNAPRAAESVARQLDAMGAPRDAWDAIVTSGDSARAAMLRGAVGRRVFHIGPPQNERFFAPLEGIPDPGIERVPLEEAEGIVCTGPVDEDDAPSDYRAIFLHAKTRGLPLLCANPDIVVDVGPRRVYCAGALAAEYTAMGGTSLYFGKPHPPLYDLARTRLRALREIEDDRILCVGDGIATDVAGALGEGLDALFVTGGLAAEETGTVRQPDPGRLAALLDAARMSADYAIGYLR